MGMAGPYRMLYGTRSTGFLMQSSSILPSTVLLADIACSHAHGQLPIWAACQTACSRILPAWQTLTSAGPSLRSQASYCGSLPVASLLCSARVLPGGASLPLQKLCQLHPCKVTSKGVCLPQQPVTQGRYIGRHLLDAYLDAAKSLLLCLPL